MKKYGLNIRNYLATFSLVILMSINGCKKEEIKASETTTVDAEKIQFQKIKRFMSIIWGVSMDDINYDDRKKVFSVNQIKVTRDEIEKIYEVSNEYKLRYEN